MTCAREGGARSLALLHCVSAYPTPDDQQNLGAIRDAGDRLRPAGRPVRSHRRRRRRRRRGGARRQPLRTARQGVGVRSRDRRGGVVLAGGARAAGGDRGARRRHDWARACGTPQPAEQANRQGSRRALYARARSRGRRVVITDADVIALRPEHGLPASRWRELIGVRRRGPSRPSIRSRPRISATPSPARRPRREARLMRLNVLITAASRRVGLVRGFQQALHRPGLAGEVMVCDVNPASPAVHIADRAFEVPVFRRPGLFRRGPRHLRRATRSGSWCRPSTTRSRASRRCAIASTRSARRSPPRRSTRRWRAPTSGRRAAGWRPPASRRRRRGCRTNCPAPPAFPLFVKPRSGRGSVRRVRGRAMRSSWRSSSATCRAGRPGVPRRPGVHARPALRLRRPAAVGRAARAGRHPGRRDRPRPDGPGSRG